MQGVDHLRAGSERVLLGQQVVGIRRHDEVGPRAWSRLRRAGGWPGRRLVLGNRTKVSSAHRVPLWVAKAGDRWCCSSGTSRSWCLGWWSVVGSRPLETGHGSERFYAQTRSVRLLNRQIRLFFEGLCGMSHLPHMH